MRRLTLSHVALILAVMAISFTMRDWAWRHVNGNVGGEGGITNFLAEHLPLLGSFTPDIVRIIYWVCAILFIIFLAYLILPLVVYIGYSILCLGPRGFLKWIKQIYRREETFGNTLRRVFPTINRVLSYIGNVLKTWIWIGRN